ncbi:MAG: plasmid pRiA4b ORF-3 family protein [archaeon]
MTKILQLKITLNGITPEIWRRFLVKDNIKFKELHEIIQTVMGWGDYHLYEFKIDDVSLTPDEHGYNAAEASFKTLFQSPQFMKMLEKSDLKKGSATLDINKMNKILKDAENNKVKNKYSLKTKLSEMLTKEKQEFYYIYDFGDNWEHTIIVEKILDEAKECPVCLEGERACPPEDCGSVDGYYELVKIKKNKNHKYYKERIVEWLGEDHDFELFNLKDINKKLLKHSIKIDGRTRYWVPK